MNNNKQMTPEKMYKRVSNFIETIDTNGCFENCTPEVIKLSNAEFELHIMTTISHGIGISVNEFKVYQNKEQYKHVMDTAMMFTTDLFCDELLDKHG